MSRIVLITGVAGGIGYATARCFKQHGWTVIGVDRQDTSSLPDIDRHINVDIAEPSAIQDAISKVQQEFGQLHGLINNAAVQICKPALAMSVTEWDEIMAVNVRAAFLTAQAAHPLLQIQTGGRRR